MRSFSSSQNGPGALASLARSASDNVGSSAGDPFVVLAKIRTTYWFTIAVVTLVSSFYMFGLTAKEEIAVTILLATLFVLLLLLLQIDHKLESTTQNAKYENVFNSLYRTAVEQQVIFCTVDSAGKVTRVNKEFEVTTGYHSTEIIGEDAGVFVRRGLQDALSPEDWKWLEAGKPWMGFTSYIAKNGRKFEVRCSIVPRLEKSGQIAELEIIAVDVAEQRKDLANAKFSSALNLIDDEIYVFEPSTFNILFVNTAGQARERTGVKNLRSGQNSRDFLSSMAFEKMLRTCEDLIASGEIKKVFSVTRRDGTPLEITLQYVVPDDDAPMFVAVYRNIAERKQAERAKAEFISTISHELRTPLTSIKGSLSLALNGALGEIPAGPRRMLDIAHNNCDRLTLLINDILELEKIEDGKLVFCLEPLDLVGVVRQSIVANASYGDKFGVKFSLLDVPNGEVTVNGDGNRLLQVLDNLLSNAAKFSKNGDKVEILIESKDDSAIITVRDKGVGIDESQRTRLFERFTQVDSSDTRSKGGTGLGLPIARSIVESHGGTLDFISKVGEGTDFFFTLPLLERKIENA